MLGLLLVSFFSSSPGKCSHFHFMKNWLHHFVISSGQYTCSLSLESPGLSLSPALCSHHFFPCALCCHTETHFLFVLCHRCLYWLFNVHNLLKAQTSPAWFLKQKLVSKKSLYCKYMYILNRIISKCLGLCLNDEFLCGADGVLTSRRDRKSQVGLDESW